MAIELKTLLHEEDAVGILKIGGPTAWWICELTVNELEDWSRRIGDLARLVDRERCTPPGERP